MRYHGVDAQTLNHLIIDAGEVRLNWSPTSDGTTLGATRGGNVFTVEQEIKDMEFDGAKGPVKGGRRVTKSTAKLTLNMIEWDTAILGMSLPGSALDSTTHTNYSELYRRLQLSSTDYKDSVTLLGEVSGSNYPVAVTIDNALHTGNFELTLSDNEEAVDKLELTAHYDPADLDKEPWHIYFPKDTTSGA